VYSIKRRAKEHPSLDVTQDQPNDRPPNQGTVQRKIAHANRPHAHRKVRTERDEQSLDKSDRHVLILQSHHTKPADPQAIRWHIRHP
jgi:hypothetical protein